MKIFDFLAIFLVLAAAAGPSQGPTQEQLSLFPKYEKISSALAQDDLAQAKSAAQALAVTAVRAHNIKLADSAGLLAKADDLTRAREIFKTVSSEAVALAQHAKGYFIVTCPMADADWVQSTKEVSNPYLGQAMLTCGSIKEETKG